MYTVHVSQFEGPLDLLLHLIESAELDIKDIFVSEITSQYLAHMERLDDLDMDTASEFLSMAATLLYIKSRQLLPRPPRDDLMEEEDPETLLIRQLHEYKVFKKAGETLLYLQAEARGLYTRLPEDVMLPQQEILLSGATLEELYGAFFSMMHKRAVAEKPHPLHQVREDAFTVRMQIAKIRDLLKLKGETQFADLFDEHPEKLEVLVTFMALLEMLSRKEIHIRQTKPFAPILLSPRALLDDDEDAEFMDEGME